MWSPECGSRRIRMKGVEDGRETSRSLQFLSPHTRAHKGLLHPAMGKRLFRNGPRILQRRFRGMRDLPRLKKEAPSDHSPRAAHQGTPGCTVFSRARIPLPQAGLQTSGGSPGTRHVSLSLRESRLSHHDLAPIFSILITKRRSAGITNTVKKVETARPPRITLPSPR